jgi:anion-transporting  ArsA/GET3 family ATPase
VPSRDFPQVRLHVVTGKGGTGKSTVAAALALGLASAGSNVLLCEVEGRQGIARMFDVEPLPYAERRIATGLPEPDGGRGGVVHALHIDPESALLEYLSMYYKLGRAGKALDRFGVVEFATTIAPGVRDVLLTGKVYEATRRNARHKDAIRYDAVVLDAPPTGRIAQFLGVNNELAGLARMGPIKSQADSVTTLFRSPRTAVHLVTVLEEMPVQETVDGIAQLREHRLPVGGVVVNQVRPRDLDDDDLTAIRARKVTKRQLTADLTRAGLDGSSRMVTGLLAEAGDHAERRALEDSQQSVVETLDVPTYELPLLVGGVDLGALYELAGLLRDQGLA